MVDSEAIPTPYDIVTSSRVKTWYMVQFKGYEVVDRRKVPKVTRQGRLTYDCYWQLRANDSQTKESAGQSERSW